MSDNPNFIALTSSDTIFVGQDMTLCLTDELNDKANIDHTHSEYALVTDLETLEETVNNKADADHTHVEFDELRDEKADMSEIDNVRDEFWSELDNKADIDHTHDEYALVDDLTILEETISSKADSSHTHSEYASVSHVHTDYATQIALDTLSEEVNGKADTSHSHDEYALSSHTHDNYSEITHNHDENYASISHTHTSSEIGAAESGHNHDGIYSILGHNHDENYSAIDHIHTDYATVNSLNELSTTVSGKADASHTHGDIYYTEQEIDTKLADKSDSSHTHTGVYDVYGAASSSLASANAYTDTEIGTLSETVGTKANSSDLTSHTGNTTVHITSTERNNWNEAKTHASSSHAPSNAEENQNAFSNIVVGSTTISADEKTDTLTIVAGDNVTITPDSTGDSITISSANTVYTHPTSTGNKHIPAGGSSGQILRWSADGTAVWGDDNDTTYSNASQTSSGLMSDTDKTKLDGIDEGANNYTLPSAGTSLGGVKSGGDVTISSGIITVNDDSHNHIISNIDGLQSTLDSKAESGHSHNDTYYTETEVDSLLSGKSNTSHTHTIANITNLQSTLDGKASTSHGTHVSYSTTVPVMDGSASVGTASTVARSDHKHPIDTSRASQTDLDALETVVEGKANLSHTHTIANITNLQTTLDGKAASSHTHTVANISDLTATATELNYMDGVTSNVQTQLNNKLSLSGGNITGKVNINGTNSNPFTIRRNSSDTESVSHSLNDNTYTISYTNDETTNRILFSFIATDTESGGGASPSESSVTILNSNNISTVTANVFSGNLSGNATTSTTATKLGSSTIGGVAKPIYLNNGTATACSSTIGSATQPVYMNGGTITACTYTLGKSVPSNAVFTDTTYSVATTSANGLMSASDKSKLDGIELATVSEVETYLAI